MRTPPASCRGLVDGDLVAQQDQVVGYGDPGRAGTDDGDLLAGRRGDVRGLDLAAGCLPIGEEPLEPADGHWVALLAQDADLLALVLLGADSAAHRRQGVGLFDLPDAGGEVALDYAVDEAGDVDVYRASADAERFLAVQAAGGFGDGGVLGVAQGDFVKILDALEGLLFGHRLAVVVYLLGQLGTSAPRNGQRNHSCAAAEPPRGCRSAAA